MYKSKIPFADIVLIIICCFILASNIKIPELYLSAYVLLMVLSTARGIINSKLYEKKETIWYDWILKIFLVIYTVAMTYLLVYKLGIE